MASRSHKLTRLRDLFTSLPSSTSTTLVPMHHQCKDETQNLHWFAIFSSGQAEEDFWWERGMTIVPATDVSTSHVHRLQFPQIRISTSLTDHPWFVISMIQYIHISSSRNSIALRSNRDPSRESHNIRGTSIFLAHARWTPFPGQQHTLQLYLKRRRNCIKVALGEQSGSGVRYICW